MRFSSILYSSQLVDIFSYELPLSNSDRDFKKTSNNVFSPFSKNNNNNNTNGKNFNETLPIKTTQKFFNYLKSTSYNIKNKSNSNNLLDYSLVSFFI